MIDSMSKSSIVQCRLISAFYQQKIWNPKSMCDVDNFYIKLAKFYHMVHIGIRFVSDY